MPIAAGQTAPPVVLDTVQGETWSRSGPVLLIFFKGSCPTCQLAFPVYGELERRYGDALPIVAVCQDPPREAAKWLADRGFSGPALDDASGGYALSEAYGVESVPTLVLIGTDDHIEKVREGWDRARVNALARVIGERTGRSTAPVSTENDGLPAFKPG